MNCDLLDWIRTELQHQPAALPLVEPILRQARQRYGGERVYVRAPERQTVTRRTLQRRQRVCGQPCG